MLPFSTLFFSHAFSALLDFGAFVLLWYERRGPPRPAWVAAAGLLAGYAFTTEFPNAIITGILGLYVLTRSGRVRRAAAYGAGVVAGILPLLLFNQWAFGSPTHLSYASQVGFGPVNTFMLGAPTFHQAVEVLFASLGLLRLTPVIAMGVVGTFLMFRRGYRLDALLITTITLAFLLFEASYNFPFGGASPGPRQLIPILPFLAVPLALSYRRFPVTTLALAVVSAVEIGALTLTRPLSSSVVQDWFSRIASADFTRTALGVAGAPSYYGIVLFFAAALLAVVFAALATPHPCFAWQETASGATLLGGWMLIERRGPELLDGDQLGKGNGALTTILVCAAIVLVAVSLPRLIIGSARGGARGPAGRDGS
jgi:hypothetical protein